MPVQASDRLFKLFGQAGGLSVRLQAGGLPYGQVGGLSVRYRLEVPYGQVVLLEASLTVLLR
jgi:hypothetical protein